MPALSSRRALATVVAGLLAVSFAPAAATPAAASTATRATSAAAQPHRVVLPTGDVVDVSAGPRGMPTAALEPRHDGTARQPAATFTLGGDLYVVPRSGTQLAAHDLAAFDVSRLAGLGARPAAHPDFPMHTLTLHGIDSAGHRDTGDAVVIANVDYLAKYNGFAGFVHGIAKVSVPDGHYSAFGFFFDPGSPTVRLVVLSQFTVHGDSQVTVDARNATVPVSVTTPRPAVIGEMDVSLARSDARGDTSEFEMSVDGSLTMMVQPVARPPRVGQLHYFVYSRLYSPRGVHPAYSYDLKFPSDGTIPARQRFVATPDSLAAVVATYTAALHPGTALDGSFSFLPWENFAFASLVPMHIPQKRVEYYTARPDLAWQQLFLSDFFPWNFNAVATYQSTFHIYQPQSVTQTTWGNGQPIHPVLEQGPQFPNTSICPACISGSTLHLLVFPFGDNDPQHYGFADFPTPGLHQSVTYGVYADDVPIAHGRNLLDRNVRLPFPTERYRIDMDTHRTAPGLRLSTDVTTSWTVPSSAPTAALPPDWTCLGTRHPERCRVLPLITADYHLPLDSLGQLTSGPATIQVSHLAGATAVAVRALHVQVSYDGGQTWRRVAVTDLGAGNYALRLDAPPAAQTDGFGALRVSVRDVSGSTFDQTIDRAFAVVAS